MQRYSMPAVILHWLTASLIIGNIALGLLTESFPEAQIRSAIDTHKSLGITILGLVLLRILWRFMRPPPPLPAQYGSIEKRLAHLAHAALYLLMIGIPLSGWMHDSAWKAAAEIPMRWFGLFQWPRIGWIMQIEPALKERLHALLGTIHEGLAYALVALVLLHVAAVLKHEWIDREAEFRRMWR